MYGLGIRQAQQCINVEGILIHNLIVVERLFDSNRNLHTLTRSYTLSLCAAVHKKQVVESAQLLQSQISLDSSYRIPILPTIYKRCNAR